MMCFNNNKLYNPSYLLIVLGGGAGNVLNAIRVALGSFRLPLSLHLVSHFICIHNCYWSRLTSVGPLCFTGFNPPFCHWKATRTHVFSLPSGLMGPSPLISVNRLLLLLFCIFRVRCKDGLHLGRNLGVPPCNLSSDSWV